MSDRSLQTGVSTTGVSVTVVAVAPVLGSLELVARVSAFFCESQWDSLGITWGCLGNRTPARWGHLWSHQFMIVAPRLYPHCKILQPIKAEACGPPELLLYVQHVIHWAPFLDAQCLLLVQEEVCKEFISQPYPLCLLI